MVRLVIYKVASPFFVYRLMELNDIQKNLILLSLSNLIEDYSNALEDNQINPEAREFMITAIHEAKILINSLGPPEQNDNNQINRPEW